MCHHVRTAVLLPDFLAAFVGATLLHHRDRRIKIAFITQHSRWSGTTVCLSVHLNVVYHRQRSTTALISLMRFFLKLRALLRASGVTNLLIARLLRLESVVDRLEKEIEVREIVQPVRPPRSDVIKPCSGHSCLKKSPFRRSDIPGFVERKSKKTRLQWRSQSQSNERKFLFCHFSF